MTDFVIQNIIYYSVWSVSIIISLIVMYFAVTHFWKFFNILLTFTSKIKELKPGKVEIKGKVQAIDIIRNIDRKAVYYKEIHETYRSTGKHKEWVVEAAEEYFLPFKVVDSTGEVLVVPKNSYAFDIKHEITKIDKHNRIKYYFLEENEAVYVLGNFSINKDEHIITEKKNIPFIISDFNELTLIIKHAFWGLAITLAAVIIILTTLAKNIKNF